MSNEKKTTDLVPFEGAENLPAELVSELQADQEEAERELVDEVGLLPPKIGMTKEGYFTIGEGTPPVATFKGIVLAMSKSNAYWHKKDGDYSLDLPENFNPDIPACSSVDGITGIPANGFESVDTVAVFEDGEAVPYPCFGKCADCFFNKFKTAVNEEGKYIGGAGKACNNKKKLLVLPDGASLPHIFMVPSTSFNALMGWATMVKGRKLPSYAVWSEFAINVKQSGQQKWATLLLSVGDNLAEKDLLTAFQMRKQYNAIVKSIPVEQE